MALGMTDAARAALSRLGLSLDDLIEHETEPGLGNGGLGRLAACYMDSLATLAIPTIGYGIRYEFGIFDQEIRDGWQVEVADRWLRYGYPWEIASPEIEHTVRFGGHVEHGHDERGRYRPVWTGGRIVKGTPYDTHILGYGVKNANLLRLWQAVAVQTLDLDTFNAGEHYRAVEERIASETISRVLYPNDQAEAGKALRLQQQYFFVSCSLQDMIRIHLQRAKSIEGFEAKYAIQLNDTHPALAVVELMRLLVDEHELAWDEAWGITTRSIGYTNHTLLPEALETWSLPLFQRLLPRPLEILFEINRRFLDEVRVRFPGDDARVARMSLVDEAGEKRVRMANLACVGSHSVNGVAALHSELLARTVLADFHDLYPGRFTNVTNGVTPRRFIALANPELARLLTETLGDGWQRDLDRVQELEKFTADSSFVERFRGVKLISKKRLADRLRQHYGIMLDPHTLFDLQVKRIHEYKRQHLNILRVIASYLSLKRGAGGDAPPRSVIFGGKAAPGYWMAKLIIRLVHGVAEVVNSDETLKGRLRIAFVPDFNVKNAMCLYPAADLSEQISTAGKEASGTGNMKFAMNGALTIGTLDGANIEICERVGAEHFFLFGLTADEVHRTLTDGYRPTAIIEKTPELREALEAVRSGLFSRGDRGLYEPLVRSLTGDDPFRVCADFASYVECQERVSRAFADESGWTRSAIFNVARMGYFSSDRSIREYASRIWRVDPVDISLMETE
jgi:starch phosphorylase